MRSLLPRLAAGVLAAGWAAGPAVGQVYATPLPPGPGTVPLPLPGGPLVAPVLLPVGAPTAAPVAVYHYGQPQAQPVAGLCDPGCPAGPRFWAAADFFYGAGQGAYVPPLVASGPAAPAGLPARPTTQVLLGDERLGDALRPGFQFRTGLWSDPALARGADAGFFFLGDLSERFAGGTGPAGGVVLLRPVVLGPTGQAVGVPVAGPTVGGLTAAVDTSVIGADGNYRRNLVGGGRCRVDLLAGYRFLHVGDAVDVWSATALPGGAGVAVARDSVRTRNNFHGGQLGLAGDFRLLSGLTVGVVTKVALGVTVSEADVTGNGSVNGVPVPTGLLAGPTNARADTDSLFGVVPEVGVRLGYDVTSCLRASVGYTFVYLSDVRRAPEQIDLTVGAPGRPGFVNRTTDFWVQGFTLGVELRF